MNGLDDEQLKNEITGWFHPHQLSNLLTVAREADDLEQLIKCTEELLEEYMSD